MLGHHWVPDLCMRSRAGAWEREAWERVGSYPIFIKFDTKMPKEIIKKYMPDPQMIRDHKHLRIFGSLLHDPRLWHFNRKNISGAFAVGLFCAFVPIPFQMVLSACIAIIVRVHIPVSVALVWVSNPITMPPLFYAAYKLGAVILRQTPLEFDFVLSWKWLFHQLELIWQPFLLGCFIFGVVSAVGSFCLVRILWAQHIRKQWQQRHSSS